MNFAWNGLPSYVDWVDWLKSLKRGDEVQVRSSGAMRIAIVSRVTAGGVWIDEQKQPYIAMRKGRVCGYSSEMRPVTATTRKEIAATGRPSEREQMNNDIRHIATKLSRRRAAQLLMFAKSLQP